MRLNLSDDALDLRRRLLRSLGQLAHLCRDHREPASMLAGPGGLDRGVERQQVGLLGKFVNHFEDATDLEDLVAEARRTTARCCRRSLSVPSMAVTASETASRPSSVNDKVSCATRATDCAVSEICAAVAASSSMVAVV